MKKVSILIYILLTIIFNSFSQTTSQNFIKSKTYLNESGTKSVKSISYSDAFGRTMQNIVFDASPLGNDIVQTVQYDSLGRVSRSYLPFLNSGDDESYIYQSLDKQQQFWQSQSIEGSDIPYSDFIFDGSHLNNIVKQSIPGKDINSVNISSDYDFAGPGIKMWAIDENNNLIHSIDYPEKSLIKHSYTGPDGKSITAYIDLAGRTVMKEKGNGVKYRYVYDVHDQLRYVLSPEAVSQMSASNYTMSDSLVRYFCYYYEYNGKQQLTIKQIPGKDPIYYRYDDLYRLRMTQDGNQRADSVWMFINYDKFGRTLSTGMGVLDGDMSVIPDVLSAPEVGGIPSELTYQYYDNYDFISDTIFEFDSLAAYHLRSVIIKGKPTGSKIRVMNPDAEEWLTSVVYYDKYGRIIQSISQNYVGGYDMVNNKYDFTGNLLESTHKHISSNSDKYLVYMKEYDSMSRLLKISMSQYLDKTNAVILNEYVYDDMGRAIEKKIHSNDENTFLLKENYEYNINGSLTDINNPANLGDDLFALKLYFDTEVPGMGNQTYKDGKISAIRWNSKNLNDVQTYTYEYDDLNRLTMAAFTPDNKYDVNFSYDLNGNITTLNRNGEYFEEVIDSGGEPIITQTFQRIDSLFYSYQGNRLLSVNDSISDFNSTMNHDFRDNGTFAAEEYFYDANGNVIKDLNKGVENVVYNHLDMPVEIELAGNNRIVYLYTAKGEKLQTKIFLSGMLEATTDYVGAFVYEDDSLQYTNILGGRIVQRDSVTTENDFEYFITDHLGNVRIVFGKDSTGNAIILQEDHYYPYGMRLAGLSDLNNDLINNYLFNEKEIQTLTGFYDYGFRQLDATIGRWHSVDQLAEKYYANSPYTYATNNPINFIDPDGQRAWHWILADILTGGLISATIATTAAAAISIATVVAPMVAATVYTVIPPVAATIDLLSSIEISRTNNSGRSNTRIGFSADWSRTVNSFQLANGWFRADRDQNIFRQIEQVTSRFTPRENLVSTAGYIAATYHNIMGQVESVHGFHGAAIVKLEDETMSGAYAVSNYIMGAEDLFTYIDHDEDDNLYIESSVLIHEYGHYLQGREWGTIAYIVGGIFSAAFNNEKHDKYAWSERDASLRGMEYFSDKGYSMQGYGDVYWPEDLSRKKIDLKWAFFLTFF